MKTPFTTDQFLEIFRRYNEELFPWQFVLSYALAAILIDQVFRTRKTSGFLVGSILAFFWIWMGWVYHITYFSSINPAAMGFGILFVVQGILFLLFSKRLVYDIPPAPRFPAITVIALALIAYPLTGLALGHAYPSAPSFGLPCPTTLFTFGLLMAALTRVPVVLMIVPSIWAVIGFTAALNFGFLEDTLLPLVAAAAWWVNSRKAKSPTTAGATLPPTSTKARYSAEENTQPVR